ncbi:GAF domain-containing protein [Streptomyces hebeiensis]
MDASESGDPCDAAARATGALDDLSAGATARVPQTLEAMYAVGAGRGLRSVLGRICESAAELTGAGYAAIGIVDEDGEGLSDFVTYGIGEDVARRIGRWPDGRGGLLGALIRDAEPIRLADLTTDTRAVGFPPGHPPMRAFLGVPIRGRDKVFGNLYVTEKSGRPGKPGSTERSEPAVTPESPESAEGPGPPARPDSPRTRSPEPAEAPEPTGVPAGPAFSTHDLHLLRVLASEAGIAIGNARLYEAVRQRERWIDGSVAVTTALLSGGDADDALLVVAEQARRLSDSALGVVMLRTPDGGLEVVAASPDHPTVRVGRRFPAQGPVTATLLSGESVFVDDIATDPRMKAGPADGLGPIMLLPLRTDGRVLGALAMPRERGARRFGETERGLADRFAAQAALALRMAEAQRDRERLAVLEDRDRIARDLHDLVIQRLFATGLMLASAQRGTVGAEVYQGIDKAVDELDVTIQEIRTAIFALQRAPAEAPSGVRARVLREISMAAEPLGFRPVHRFVGPVDSIGEAAGRNLVAALREALSNAFRHARATRVEVVVDAAARLADGRRAVRLTVADDGVGIAPGGRRSGLRNLRRRAESLGGSSTYEEGLGEGGTTVVWEAPL